jgi:hypothetical protein
MPISAVLSKDYISFSGLYESCERDHAADMIEMADIQFVIAGCAQGDENCADSLQEKRELYLFLL